MKRGIIAALAAAVALSSACGADGNQAASDDSPAPTTNENGLLPLPPGYSPTSGTATPAYSVTPVPSGGPGYTPPSIAAPPTVPGGVTVQLPPGPYVALPDSYGGIPADGSSGTIPGMGVTVSQPSGPDTAATCTIGWPVRSNAGRTGFLTAGHCDKSDGPVSFVSPTRDIQLAADYIGAEQGTGPSGARFDAAFIGLPSDVVASNRYRTNVTAGVRIAGGLNRDAVRSLPAGTPLCMMGGRAGVTCGPMVSAGPDVVKWGGFAVKGDSGSGVFLTVRTANGYDAYAVGLLSSGDTDRSNEVTYLDDALSRWGLNLLLT